MRSSAFAVLYAAMLWFIPPTVALAETVVVHSPPASLGAEEVTSVLVSQAVAQHQAVQPGESSVIPTTPSVTEGDDFAGVVKLVVQAVGTRNWSLLAVVGVLVAVYVARRVGASFWPWLRSDVAGVLLSFVTAALFTLASALAAGVPLSGSLVLGAVLTAASASGIWAWGKKLTAKPTVSGADLSR